MRAIETHSTETADHLLSPHVKLFEKIKIGLELVSLFHFLHNFWKKIFLLLYSIIWPNSIVWLPLLWEIFGNMYAICMQLSVNQVATSGILKLTYLSNHTVVPKWPKSRGKNLNILKPKKVFRGLSMRQITQSLFGRWESCICIWNEQRSI